MIIKREQLTDCNTTINHLILHCLGKNPTILEEVVQKGQADVKLIINDKEIEDFESFIDHWSKHIDKEIENIVQSKISNKTRKEIERFIFIHSLLHGMEIEEKR